MITQRMMVGGGDDSYVWQITVHPQPSGTSPLMVELPFNLYNQPDVEIVVDWGDGESITLDSSKYSAANNYAPSQHTYSNEDNYTVRMSIKNSEKMYFRSKGGGTDRFTTTLISIDTPLPKVKGVRQNTTEYNNSLEYLFSSCNLLTIIPEDLLVNNQDIVDAQYLFSSCNFSAIPEKLFWNNPLLQKFDSAFAQNTALVTVPESLFRFNTQALSFNSLFSSCTGLTSIPEGLFSYNTLATNFGSVCYGCPLDAMPTGLFANNSAITKAQMAFYSSSLVADFSIRFVSANIDNTNAFVAKKTGATRTIYVPSGSTTETTFNAVASSLGLTIIGE